MKINGENMQILITREGARENARAEDDSADVFVVAGSFHPRLDFRSGESLVAWQKPTAAESARH